MSIKKEQMAWLFLATIFTGSMIFFVKDSATVTGIAWSFTVIVGTFIGVDLAAMIKKTSEMPGGQYKKMNKHRYITALIILALLLGEAFFINKKFNRSIESLVSSFGMGFLFIIGGLIAGVEGNKIVTKEEEKEPTIGFSGDKA